MAARTKGFLLFFLNLLLIPFSVLAQQSIGDKIPNLRFSSLINSKSSSITLSDFAGKLIILDFWAFNCSNCIEDFAKLETLQNKFKGKVQIILVNHENQIRTIEFFEKRKKMFKRPELIFITGDTILSKMFPKDYIPWDIWIDGEQRFQFATDGSDVTEDRIESFINTGQFAGDKLKPHPDFNKHKPLFEQSNKEYLNSIQFISYISKYDGLGLFGTGFYLYKPGKMRLLMGATNSIEELLIAAFSENYTLYDFVSTNVSLEVSDTLKFRRPHNGDPQYNTWLNNYSYNYDCILPESNSKQAYEIMRRDLTNFFNVKVSIEKRKAKSLVLVRITKEDKLLSKGVNKEIIMDNGYTMYNYPFSDFVKDIKIIFRSFSVPYPLIDETGYNGKIDIEGINTESLNGKDKDILKFRISLQKYGLDLIEKECLQDILVIRDK